MNLEIELPDDVPTPDPDPEEVDHPLRTRMRKTVQVFADAWFRTPLRIALTGIVVLICFGVIGWNLQRLSVLDELVAAEVAEFELEDKLSDLQMALTRIDMPALADALAAEDQKVFQGFPELAAWAEGLSNLAARRGIAFSYRVEPAHLAGVPGLLEVPVLLEFKASAEGADRLFTGTMDLIGTLLGDHWHLEVLSAHGKGSGERLERLSLRAQVWVRDRFGFVDPESLSSVGSPEKGHRDAEKPI